MNDVPALPPIGPRQKTSGYLVVLYVVLGLLAFSLVAGSLAVWMFLRSDTGQRIVTSVNKGVTVIQQAASAPGTPQLRALGCERALVIPLNQLMDIAKEVAPDGAGVGIDRSKLPGNGTMVLCQVLNLDEAPACEQVAHTFAEAVPQPPERFTVSVQARGRSRCQGTYNRDGTQVATPGGQLER